MSEGLKPEVQPTMKKQHSYTYWVDANNKSRQLPPQHQPKRIEAPVQAVTNQQGPSAWNSCGTWEQKKISIGQIESNLKQFISQLLGKPQFEGVQIGTLELEGEAYKVFKKNKWNVVYQLKGSIEFKKQQNKAKIKIVQLTNHGGGDREYEVTGNSEVKKTIQPQVEGIVKALEEILAKHNN